MSQDNNHIQQSIADLEAWRDRIEVTLQTLRLLNTNGPVLPAAAPPGSSRNNGEISNDTFFQMTVPDAAEKYLKLMKATKEIPEVADSLLKGGLKSSSKNFNDMVRTVISRDSRFVRVPGGGWGLAEWYPAMRKEKKSRAAASNQPSNPTTPQEEKTNEPEKADAASKIIAAIGKDPGAEWTASKIATATGIKLKTVQGTIFRLRKDEKITNRTNGLGYTLA